MKKTVWAILTIVVLAAMLLSACSSSGGSDGTVVKNRKSPPADYAGMTNPFAGKADAVTQGQDLYKTNCATCHGDTAKGDGAAGASLDPKPANLNVTAKETDVTYMHWVVSEGGQAAGLSSSMVAFKGILSDDDIWKIVTYLKETYGK